MQISSIGILLFDEVELLDFAGPLQVFSAAKYLYPELFDTIETVGLTKTIFVSKSNLEITPHRVIDETQGYDLFLIPGGFGTRPIIKDDGVLQKIKKETKRAELVCSVCTGSLVLAKLGLLHKKTATTHFAAVDLLTQLDPTITVDRTQRYIDNDDIIVSEGVSAGIDMSFYILKKLYGEGVASEVKKYIEY